MFNDKIKSFFLTIIIIIIINNDKRGSKSQSVSNVKAKYRGS